MLVEDWMGTGKVEVQVLNLSENTVTLETRQKLVSFAQVKNVQEVDNKKKRKIPDKLVGDHHWLLKGMICIYAHCCVEDVYVMFIQAFIHFFFSITFIFLLHIV